jgi:sugar/nucleoside kinase (ribokinase family)
MKNQTVVGVGAALVDLLLREEDRFLESLGSPKGGMTLVEHKDIEKAIASSSQSADVVPGGSACNTLVGIGKLGGSSRMIGRCGADEKGYIFVEGLKKAGVQSVLGQSTQSTGQVLSVVTPDAQRTMFTYLGAAAELSPEDVQEKDFLDAGVVHMEGYLLWNAPVVEALSQLMDKSDALISLDLASFDVVEAHRNFLKGFIPKYVDILIANEDEAKAYTGLSEEESLEVFAELSDIAVVKLGKEGALIAQGSKRYKVNAHVVDAIDTTGAGDLWASGFLYGLTHGYDVEKSAKLGSIVAAEVVQVMGAVIPQVGWDRIEIAHQNL